jgi:hypothetical protein
VTALLEHRWIFLLLTFIRSTGSVNYTIKMAIEKLLSPESKTLLIAFLKEVSLSHSPGSSLTGMTGSLLGEKAGLLPQHGAYRGEVCTEEDCSKVRNGIKQLLAQSLIFPLFPVSGLEAPYGRDQQWKWLNNNAFWLTESGFIYADWLTSPWHRRAGKYLKQHVWSILAAISATATLVLFILQILGYL